MTGRTPGESTKRAARRVGAGGAATRRSCLWSVRCLVVLVVGLLAVWGGAAEDPPRAWARGEPEGVRTEEGRESRPTVLPHGPPREGHGSSAETPDFPLSSPDPGGAPSPAPSAHPSPAPSPHAATTEMVSVDGIEILRLSGRKELSARERATILTDRLESLLKRSLEPPQVDAVEVGSDYVLLGDKANLVAVSDGDATLEGLSKAATAVQWRGRVEDRLQFIWEERNGKFLRYSVQLAVSALLIGCVLHLLIGWGMRRFLHLPGWAVQGLMWMTIVVVTLWLAPSTRGLSRAAEVDFLKPASRLLMLVLLTLAARLALRVILHRYAAACFALWGEDLSRKSRRAKRVDMLHQTALILLDVLMVMVWVLGLLTVLNINPTAMLAGAGVVGVAVGVGFQDLLKDVTAGVGILVEDQFGVGDTVAFAHVKGQVVSFTLRSTRIRGEGGSLFTVPNSEMRIIENHSVD